MLMILPIDISDNIVAFIKITSFSGIREIAVG